MDGVAGEAVVGEAVAGRRRGNSSGEEKNNECAGSLVGSHIQGEVESPLRSTREGGGPDRRGPGGRPKSATPPREEAAPGTGSERERRTSRPGGCGADGDSARGSGKSGDISLGGRRPRAGRTNGRFSGEAEADSGSESGFPRLDFWRFPCFGVPR